MEHTTLEEALYFVSGNPGKIREVKATIPGVKNIDIDLPEIQELDPKKVIEEKLKEATKHRKGEFFLEDTSLYISALNGFPGPLIKWFSKSLGNEGIANLVANYSDQSAVARTVIGHTDGGKLEFFEGKVEGTIVSPRGPDRFGWDPIFLPEGHDKTFAEDQAYKSEVSMRMSALLKLKKYLGK